ncbi:hypothetical protein Droror1_Dr00003053 [Drosera rotundifolia]
MFGSLVKVETLHFHHGSLPKKLQFHSLPTLRCLILRHCAHIKVIEMFNNLELTKLYCDMHRAIWWDLTGAPNLEKLELRALIDGERGINPLFADGPIIIPRLTHHDYHTRCRAQLHSGWHTSLGQHYNSIAGS